MDRRSVINTDREIGGHPSLDDLVQSEQHKSTKNNFYKGNSSSSEHVFDSINKQATRGKGFNESYCPSPRSPTATEFPVHRPVSRHESANKKISFTERPDTFMSIPGSARRRSAKTAGRHNLKAHQSSSGEEDDEVISDLLGTVRQYAQEIREIYAPMKKDEEERTRKKNERNVRRKSKEFNKDHAVHSDKQIPSHFHLEVRGEINKLEDSIHDNNFERGKSKQGISNSRSHQTSPTNHTSLQVEDANLSSSWPRNNQMSTSLERYWSDVGGVKHKPVTSSSPKAYNRSKTPSDWCEASAVQHEKEMLNRAFQRINKPYGDPLIGNFAKNIRPVSQIQEQLLDSRQSVIEVARQHKQAKQSALPSISVVAPPTDLRNSSRRSSGGMLPLVPAENGVPYSPTSPSAPPLDGEEEQ